MPETILSRLQRYDFRRIPYLKILERLQDLAGREGVEVEETAIRLLAREAGGSMRDAERMLETAIATSAGKVTEAEVASSLGVASRTTVSEVGRRDSVRRTRRRRSRTCANSRAAAPTSNRSGAICSRRSEISRSRNFPPAIRTARSTTFPIMKWRS